jgi:hypothetical protein
MKRKPTHDKLEDRTPQRFDDAISKVIEWIAAENISLALIDDFLSPKPASLSSSSVESVALEKRISRIIQRFGGPPRLAVRSIDGSGEHKSEAVDEYPAAAFGELVNMFHRTRRAVCRSQMVLVGSGVLHDSANVFKKKMPPEMKTAFLATVDSSFWEYAEIAYIRLASYWDRAGQMLDFAFFSIRQFERDGFTAVVDRIHTNLVPMDQGLLQLPEWKALRTFQTSDKEDGLHWLLRRRNLIIHSIYLRPMSNRTGDVNEAPDGEPLFRYEFNHLEEKLRKKLKPGTALEEIERLNKQLTQAAALFPAVLALCEYAAEQREAQRGK